MSGNGCEHWTTNGVRGRKRDSSLLLPSRTHGMTSRIERHASVDRRTTIGLRVDGKLPIHQLHPLCHTDKAKPAGFHCLLDVKTGSRIAHGEVDRVRGVAQLDIEVPQAAVLDCILQRFLQDTKEAKRNLLRKRAWDLIMIKDSSTFCWSENSLQNAFMAGAMPRYSSFGECNS